MDDATFVPEDDFRALLAIVVVMQNNMELNYNAFRHTADLTTMRESLDSLFDRYFPEEKRG